MRAFALGLLLVGCATVPTGIADADESRVAGCRYLGDVTGTSGWGGVAAGPGMDNARNDARAQAARLGATHVVWQAITGGYGSSAHGRAYACT